MQFQIVNIAQSVLEMRSKGAISVQVYIKDELKSLTRYSLYGPHDILSDLLQSRLMSISADNHSAARPSMKSIQPSQSHVS